MSLFLIIICKELEFALVDVLRHSCMIMLQKFSRRSGSPSALLIVRRRIFSKFPLAHGTRLLTCSCGLSISKTSCQRCRVSLCRPCISFLKVTQRHLDEKCSSLPVVATIAHTTKTKVQLKNSARLLSFVNSSLYCS